MKLDWTGEGEGKYPLELREARAQFRNALDQENKAFKAWLNNLPEPDPRPLWTALQKAREKTRQTLKRAMEIERELNIQ